MIFESHKHKNVGNLKEKNDKIWRLEICSLNHLGQIWKFRVKFFSYRPRENEEKSMDVV